MSHSSGPSWEPKDVTLPLDTLSTKFCVFGFFKGYIKLISFVYMYMHYHGLWFPLLGFLSPLPKITGQGNSSVAGIIFSTV